MHPDSNTGTSVVDMAIAPRVEEPVNLLPQAAATSADESGGQPMEHPEVPAVDSSGADAGDGTVSQGDELPMSPCEVVEGAPAVVTFPDAFTPGRPARAPNRPNKLLGVGSGEDTVLDGGRFLDGVVRAASVRGNRHRWENERRQDAMRVGAIETARGRFAVLAVADGVGSAARSDQGSAVAVRHAVEAVEEHLSRPSDGGAIEIEALFSEATAAAARAIHARAADLNAAGGDLATTLTLAVLAEAEPGHVEAWICSIGDSGFRVLRAGSFEQREADPEIRETATAALPFSPNYGIDIVRLGPGDALLLATDGFLDLLADPQRTARFADQLGACVTSGLAQFLWVVDASVRSFDDDRTVACFWAGV